MFLLPIAHQDLTVRRLPWVTILIFVTCVGVQIWSDRQNAKLDAPYRAWQQDVGALLSQAQAECARFRQCDPKAFAQVRSAEELVKVMEHPGLHGRFTSDAQDLQTRFDTLIAQHSTSRLGYRPAIDGLGLAGLKHILLGMFTHGGWAHLLGNMLLVYLIGTSIEDRWGRWRFALFYLVGGIVATLTYRQLHLTESTPLVGASGAIAAGMGAFSVLYFWTRIKFFYVWLFPLKIGTFQAPAWLALFLWFMQQILETEAEMLGHDNVAYSAHAGGFVFGAGLAWLAQVSGIDRTLRESVDAATGEWKEDADFIAAQRAVTQQNDVRAITLLTRLLTRNPAHLDAHLLAYDIALRKQNLPELLRHCDVAFPEWQKASAQECIEHFLVLDDLLSTDQKRRLPGPRTFGAVLSAARTLRDVEAAQRVLMRLVDEPQHATLPRAVFVCGEIAKLQGNSELANGHFRRLIRDWPQDTFAAMAREQLGE